jgi:uncharacterized lipoprotein YddW (UPF0748 family)
VNNIDWPSQPGLPVEKQKAELLAIVERAAQLRLNAIIFQVRPACDALYPSSLEPWSEYLTGKTGEAPSPSWDPLAFAIEESHQRGIELHAWFNPFRARHKTAKSSASANHVSRLHPEWTKAYGEELWLDPGEPAAQEYSMRVILDVLRRYDVDGVHIDDYFYPYPVKNGGQTIGFPDESSWSRYRRQSETRERNDWRRANVDAFVQRLNREIHAAKPWAKFGISPFGIWRPGVPSDIRTDALDAYDELYADARKWMLHGWADYFAPQLYWTEGSQGTSYSSLLKWWLQQNAKDRHVWPGLIPERIFERGWPLDEIIQQIKLARQQSTGGCVFFSARSLSRQRGTTGDLLAKQVFNEPALVPESPWLGVQSLTKPRVRAALSSSFKATFENPGASSVRFWVVQTRTGTQWTTRVLSGSRDSLELPGVRPEVVAVTAIGRSSLASPASVLRLAP